MSSTPGALDIESKIQQARQGNRAAFDDMVKDLYPLVYAIALSRFPTAPERAEELAQEVFLRMFLQLKSLNNAHSLNAWLAQITRNLATDWQRKDRRASALVQMIDEDHPDALAKPSNAPSPRELTESSQIKEQLSAAIAKLPESHRELLLLHYSEGLSQSEIARRLGVNPSTVMRRIDSGLDRLRSLYNQGSAENLKQLRSSNHNRAKTLAILASAWVLPQAGKTALAATADSLFKTPPMSAGIAKSFASSTTTKLLIAGGIAITLAAVWILGDGNSILPGGAAGEKIDEHRNNMTIINAIDDTATGRNNNHRGSSLASMRKKTAGGSHANTTSAPKTVNDPHTTESQVSHHKQPANQKSKRPRLPGGTPGRVLDENGKSLSEMQVHFSVMTPSQPRSSFLNAAGKPVYLSQPVQQLYQTDTDIHGNFYVDPRVTGTAVMSINQPPFAQFMTSTTLPADNLEARLTMKAAKVRGTVKMLKNGAPVAGARVSTLPAMDVKFQNSPDQATQILSLPGKTLWANTDNQGRYELDRLPDDAWISVEARADNLLMVPRKFLGPDKIKSQAGKTSDVSDIILYAGYTMRGRITDKTTGMPIANAVIGEENNFNLASGKKDPQAASDSEGYYELTGLNPYEHTFKSKDDPENILKAFVNITAQASGYKPGKYRPVQSGGFDPDNLVIYHDYELTPDDGKQAPEQHP